MSNGSWIVVAFITLDFQRIMEKRPELSAQIEDVSGQLAHMERLAQEAAEGEMPEDSPALTEHRTILATLHSQAEVIIRAGTVWDLPRSTETNIDFERAELRGKQVPDNY